MPRFGAVVVLFVAVLPTAAQDMPLSQILIEGEDWQVAADGFTELSGLAADSKGNVVVSDPDGKGLFALHGSINLPMGGSFGSLTFGPDGTLYARRLPGFIVKIDGAKITVLAKGLYAAQLAASPSGHLYCTVLSQKAQKAVYLVSADGKTTVVDEGEVPCFGLMLWGDGGTLVLGPREGKHLWALRVEKDGRLKYKEGYYELRVPPHKKAIAVRGLTRDGAGRLYAATALGVQVFDPAGRLSGVLPLPRGSSPTALAFGGPDRDTLYAACGDKLFALKLRGTALWPKKK